MQNYSKEKNKLLKDAFNRKLRLVFILAASWFLFYLLLTTTHAALTKTSFQIFVGAGILIGVTGVWEFIGYFKEKSRVEKYLEEKYNHK